MVLRVGYIDLAAGYPAIGQVLLVLVVSRILSYMQRSSAIDSCKTVLWYSRVPAQKFPGTLEVRGVSDVTRTPRNTVRDPKHVGYSYREDDVVEEELGSLPFRRLGTVLSLGS